MGYITDLTDSQRCIIESFFVRENRGKHFGNTASETLLMPYYTSIKWDVSGGCYLMIFRLTTLKDFEVTVSSAENMVMISHLATLLR